MTVAKEPYWTIENWFGGLQESAGEGLGMMLACTGFPVLFLLIALVGPELSGEPRRPRGRVLTTSARCLLLTPLTVVVPVTLWALAVALSEMPNRWAFGGTVTWHQSALIGCAGSMWAALIVVLTSIGFSVFTAVRHRERPAYECQHCGYALSGLPESCPCPECGTESRA